jgi:Zn-dependent protease
MQGSFKLARLFGIDVRVHATWILAFVVVSWGLASGYFRFLVPRQAFGTALELGGVAAVLLFASVLVHEFSHSLVARALGLRVRDITLFIFGGVSNIGGEARSPRDEFLISFVGPLTSLVLAALFWALGQVIGPLPGLGALLGSPRFVTTTSPVAALVGYLAFANLALGVFNLLPAFPLDGGRVLRSIVWRTTGNFERATSVAAILGQGLAFVLIALGIVRVVTGDFGGVWTAFIGWFLSQAAGATRRELKIAPHEPPTARPSVAW